MNRLSILSISVMTVLGLALVPSGAVAQQRSLKEQLVGTWTLVSLENTAPNGTKRQPLGANPKGILILDASGSYAELFGRPDRPKYKNPSQPTTEERAAAQAFAANFGAWSVSEADKTFTQRVEGALVPNNEGTDVKGSVTVAGDELKLTRVLPIISNTQEFVYRRAK
jgi:hypothetical protein